MCNNTKNKNNLLKGKINCLARKQNLVSQKQNIASCVYLINRLLLLAPVKQLSQRFATPNKKPDNV